MARQFSISGFIRFKDEATEQIKKVGAAIAGLKERGATFSAGVANVNQGMAAMSVAGTAVGAGFGVAINRAATFEESLAILNSVSDMNAQQLEMVKQKALELGGSTVFTANQVAQGFTELAKAGLPVEQQLQSINGVLAAAATEGLQMGQAAEIVTGILQGQSMTMDKASHVANVLAAAANQSSAGMVDLGEAFKYANGLAQNGALTFEQTAGALSVLANAGLKGSIAGTSLTSMFEQISKPSKKVLQTFANLGMSPRFTDPETGKLMALPDIINKIDLAASKMIDDQERLAFIQDLVGTSGAKAFFALRTQTKIAAGETESSYDRMVRAAQNASEGVGAATEMARKRLNSLKGDFEELSGGVDTATIGLGAMFTPALREAVKALAAMVGPVAETITAINKPFDALTKRDMDLMNTPMGAFFIGFKIGIVETIEAVKSFATTVREQWARFAPMFGGSEQDLGRFVAKALLLLVALAPLAAAFVAVTFAAGTFGRSIFGVWQIATALTPSLSTVTSMGRGTGRALSWMGRQAQAAGGALARTGVGARVLAGARSIAMAGWLNFGAAMSRAGAMTTVLRTGVMALGRALIGLFANPVGLVILAIVALIAAGVLLYQNWETVTAFLASAWQSLVTFATTAANWIADKWNNLSNVAKLLGLAIMFISGPVGWVMAGIILLARNWDAATAWMSAKWDAFTGAIGTGVAALTGWWQGLDADTRATLYNIASVLTFGLLPAFRSLYDNWGKVTDFIKNAWLGTANFLGSLDWGKVLAAPFKLIGKLIASVVELTTKIPGASAAFGAFGIDVAGLNAELAELTTIGSLFKPTTVGAEAGEGAKILPFRPLERNQSTLAPTAVAPLDLLGTGTDGPTLAPPVSIAGSGFGAQVTDFGVGTAAALRGPGTQPNITVNVPPQPPIEATFHNVIELDGEVAGRNMAKRSIQNAERRGAGVGPDTRSILRNGPVAGQVGVD